MKIPKALPVAVLGALLLIPGCGGDDDSLPETPITPTTESAGPLSKDDFIAQADGICAEVNAAVGTIEASTTDPASAVSQEADLYEGMVERIKDLGRPDDDAGLDEFLAAGDDLAQAEADARLAAERGDDAGLAAAESDAAAALSDFQSAAESYGFEDCGQGPSAPSTVPTAPGTTPPAAPVAPPAATTPVVPAPVTPAPVPAPPPPPSGGAGTGGGATDGGGGSAGGNSGSGGIGPG
jgi:hypothetical protein